MLKAKIFVCLKPSVLDPQGKAVSNSLHQLGFESVTDTRISKYIEICFAEDDRMEVIQKTEQICDTLLANPNTEQYSFELETIE
jgi:phosphoribosylformylglycinamidine synthase